LPREPGLRSRLANLPRMIARLSPRKKIALALLAALVMVTWLAACAVLATFFL
jgi:hypothetical protein